MSEIKPVYQFDIRQTGTWFECTLEEFNKMQEACAELVDFRILYPAADYEALKEKLARLNGLYHSEVSKHQLDYNALKAENEAIQKELTHWKANHADLKERLHVATHRTDLPSDRLPLFDGLKAENEAQAKRIEEVKTFLAACAEDSMSRNNRQQLAGELLDMLNGDSK